MEALIAEWSRAKAGSLEFIESMPEELFGFKPTQDVFSFAEQFVHVASANYRFASLAGGRENPYDKSKGNDPSANDELKTKKAALLEFTGSSYDFVVDSLRTMTDDSMAQTVTFHKWDITRGTAFSKALEHHAHHRGQTVVYFRLNSLKPPAERLF
jgi:uncharacterized damage-inducible protein DinB